MHQRSSHLHCCSERAGRFLCPAFVLLLPIHCHTSYILPSPPYPLNPSQMASRMHHPRSDNRCHSHRGHNRRLFTVRLIGCLTLMFIHLLRSFLLIPLPLLRIPACAASCRPFRYPSACGLRYTNFMTQHFGVPRTYMLKESSRVLSSAPVVLSSGRAVDR